MKYSIRLCLACLALLGSAAAQTITNSQDIRLRYNPLIPNSPLIHGLFYSAPASVPHQIAGNGLCRPRARAENYGTKNEDDRILKTPVQNFDFVSRHRLAMPVASAGKLVEDDCPTDKHGCHTCVEHWDDDDDKCVDNPGVTHHSLDYNPGSGESCWVITRCLCEQGQYPGSESCSPCGYSGQEAVCISR
jgi:hypothetical protein